MRPDTFYLQLNLFPENWLKIYLNESSGHNTVNTAPQSTASISQASHTISNRTPLATQVPGSWGSTGGTLGGWFPRPLTTEPPLWAGLGWTQQCCARYQQPVARGWSACITSSTILQYTGIYASRYFWYFKQISTQHTYIHTMMAGKSLLSEDQVNASDFCKVES